ncbi:MAG: SAM-dependent methyltransferase [Lawsonella clevelandensis]
MLPCAGEELWDVGAGSGSIAIEWCRLTGGTAHCFEAEATRHRDIIDNAERLGVTGLTLCGGAPASFGEVETAPAAIFIGGGVTTPGIVTACWECLMPGGRLVATAVTTESLRVVEDACARYGGCLTEYSEATYSPLGHLQILETPPPTCAMGGRKMTVYFIGAGPGAADLLTVRAVELLKRCPVCLYAGSIVPPEVLAYCPPRTTSEYRTSAACRDYRSNCGCGCTWRRCARLHSGDISVYSAVNEQIRHLRKLGIDYSIVPGVPAFACGSRSSWTGADGAYSYAISYSHPCRGRASAMPPGETLANLAASGATLALHLAAAYTDSIVEKLLPLYGPECACAVVAYASRPEEQVLRCRLSDLSQAVADAGIRMTAVIFVGPGVDLAQAHLLAAPTSYLYSDNRPRDAYGHTICSIADREQESQ